MSRLSRRRFLQSVAAGSLAGTVAGCAPPSASDPARGGPAELVLFGGRVLLMDAGSTVAEAVAIKGGSVVAAGASCDMREWIGPRTTTYNLGGKTALPGINDAHLHGVRTGLALPPYNLDVGPAAVSSIADIAAAVGAAAKAATAGSGCAARAGTATSSPSGACPPVRTSTRWRPTSRSSCWTGRTTSCG